MKTMKKYKNEEMMIKKLQMVNPSCDCLGSLDMKNTSAKGLRGNHYIQNEDP
jgi:hypothetical protein